MKRLTFKQSALLAFMIQWHRDKGALPTMSEAARTFGISETAARGRLALLIRAGYVARVGGQRACVPVRDLEGRWIGPQRKGGSDGEAPAVGDG